MQLRHYTEEEKNAVMSCYAAELYRWRYRSERELKERIMEYVDFYNNIRPHEKLQYKTPAQVEEEYLSSL